MPPRRNAEAGTVDAQSPAAVGNVDAQDLAATQELVLKQEDMIQRLAAKIEMLEATTEKIPTPPQQVIHVPPPVAEGAKRYRSEKTELTLIRAGTGHEMHGGQLVPVPIIIGKPIDFNRGVYETADLDEITYLDEHPGNGTEFFEDPTAMPVRSNVQVTDGLRSTETTPRVPLSAPMGQ